jgi:membrane-bound metal-dependent hydrolase YbcI (DUF457 family)
MFIGHIAVGLAAKRLAPKTSLGLLVAAPLAVDLLWPVLVLAGVEQVRIDPGNTAFTPLAFTHYPWSHSLLMALVWSVAAGAAYWLWRRYRAGAVVIGAGVLSHWAMDALVHRPDLPLYPGSSTMIGLGLWNSVPATLAVECAIFAAGVWLYASGTKSRDGVGKYGFWGFVVFLAAVYAINLLGPPPPSARAIGFAGLALWLLPLCAWWFDSHRTAVTSAR